MEEWSIAPSAEGCAKFLGLYLFHSAHMDHLFRHPMLDSMPGEVLTDMHSRKGDFLLIFRFTL
jgi:hypothetical protein